MIGQSFGPVFSQDVSKDSVHAVTGGDSQQHPTGLDFPLPVPAAFHRFAQDAGLDLATVVQAYQEISSSHLPPGGAGGEGPSSDTHPAQLEGGRTAADKPSSISDVWPPQEPPPGPPGIIPSSQEGEHPPVQGWPSSGWQPAHPREGQQQPLIPGLLPLIGSSQAVDGLPPASDAAPIALGIQSTPTLPASSEHDGTASPPSPRQDSLGAHPRLMLETQVLQGSGGAWVEPTQAVGLSPRAGDAADASEARISARPPPSREADGASPSPCHSGSRQRPSNAEEEEAVVDHSGDSGERLPLMGILGGSEGGEEDEEQQRHPPPNSQPGAALADWPPGSPRAEEAALAGQLPASPDVTVMPSQAEAAVLGDRVPASPDITVMSSGGDGDGEDDGEVAQPLPAERVGDGAPVHADVPIAPAQQPSSRLVSPALPTAAHASSNFVLDGGGVIGGGSSFGSLPPSQLQAALAATGRMVAMLAPTQSWDEAVHREAPMFTAPGIGQQAAPQQPHLGAADSSGGGRRQEPMAHAADADAECAEGGTSPPVIVQGHAPGGESQRSLFPGVGTQVGVKVAVKWAKENVTIVCRFFYMHKESPSLHLPCASLP